jgi:hypothetical protein
LTRRRQSPTRIRVRGRRPAMDTRRLYSAAKASPLSALGS